MLKIFDTAQVLLLFVRSLIFFSYFFILNLAPFSGILCQGNFCMYKCVCQIEEGKDRKGNKWRERNTWKRYLFLCPFSLCLGLSS